MGDGPYVDGMAREGWRVFGYRGWKEEDGGDEGGGFLVDFGWVYFVGGCELKGGERDVCVCVMNCDS